MTEEEKELENKIKQYQYEIEENKKRLEKIGKDMHKGNKKKTLIYKMNKALGKFWAVYITIWIIGLSLALIMSLGFVMNGLNSFDAVQIIEDKYDMDLKILSREAENKIITYHVKPKTIKYNNVEFLVIRVGRTKNLDDFGARYIKYIIEKMKDKELLADFDIIDNYNSYGLLEYNVIYNGEKESSSEKIQNLKDYILNYDKNINKFINIEEIIK